MILKIFIQNYKDYDDDDVNKDDDYNDDVNDNDNNNDNDEIYYEEQIWYFGGEFGSWINPKGSIHGVEQCSK